MTKRGYFYTDFAAAVWMVKTFRMKLQAGTFCLQPESLDGFLEVIGKGTRAERYVVHPDSVVAIEPRLGDVVEETANGKTKVKKLVAKDFPLTGISYEILQRAGKAFIMPERASGA